MSKVLVLSASLIVFAAAASKPDGANLGFALFSGAMVADAERDSGSADGSVRGR